MNKSIRILNIPLNLITEIESKGVYLIHQLLNNLEKLGLAEQEVFKLQTILTDYKKREFNRELVGYKEIDKYEFINSLYTFNDLDLSLRSINALNNHGIQTLSKLLLVIEHFEIYEIENLGAKSIVHVMELVLAIVKREELEDVITIYNSQSIIDDVSIYNMNFTQGAISSLERLGLLKLGDIRQAYLTGELSQMFNYKTLNVIIKNLQQYFNLKPDPNYYFFKLYLIEEKLGFIKKEELADYIKKNQLEVSINDVLEKLKSRDDLIIENGLIRLPYFQEKLKSINLKKESEDIILERFSGKTLQEVADKFGKTRERIRQIVRDRMLQITMFYEEAFVKEYNKFYWYPGVFILVFDLDLLSYNVIKYLGKNYSFEEVPIYPENYIKELMDSNKIKRIDLEFLKASLPEIFPPKIEIYGQLVEQMSKREFLEYVIEHFVDSAGMHKKKVVELANRVALENNLDYSYDKYIDIVTNTIQGLQNIRYYNYNLIDENALGLFRRILSEVDSVYSCTYFYLKYKEELTKYGIRDGYELHFVLRRYFDSDEEILKTIDFHRQPMIAKKGLTFADVVYQNWQELKSIINVDDFATCLIERYGYHRGTLINVINSTLGNYISLRQIHPFAAKLNSNIRDKVGDILRDDFYELEELANIFKEQGILEEDYQYFSNSWLNKFGYKTHDINYVIKEEFSTLKNVFYESVLKEDIYQISKKDQMMRETTLILFIENLRQEYLAFPTKGNKLITMKYLNKLGLEKSEILEYVEELKKYLKKDEYFTYYYLKKNKYEEANPIFKKIENYNLSKELMISFIRNIPGIKKTTKGNLYRVSKKATTISGFIDYISEKYNLTEKKEIKKVIKEYYGISIRNI